MPVTTMPTAAAVQHEMYLLDSWAELTLTRFLAREAGLAPGTACRVQELTDRIRAAERHRAGVRRWVRALAGAGLLAFDPHTDTAHGVRVPSADEIERAYDATSAVEHCCGPALRRFYGTCAEHLGELIRDEISVQSLLFADPQIAEEIYAGNAASRQVNELAADRVARLAPAGGRVVEIGAGVGATTDGVLRMLDPSVRYDFTDIGEYFLTDARCRWGARPGFATARYDLHLEPDAQGYEPGTIDLVLAANVLHNGRDGADTLARLRRLLRGGGHLVMIETGREHHPLLLSMYLLMSPPPTDPYAGPRDQRRHDGRILLRRDEWHAAAVLAGFEVTALEPAATDPLAPMAQFVLVARNPTPESALSLGDHR